MSPVTVTGGAGFIGGHLVERLVADGHEVTVLDDLSSGKEANLADVRDRIRFILGDLRNPGAVRRALEGAETVFHVGAIPSVPRSIEDPTRTTEVNILGTLHVLEAARALGVQRVIFSSSSSVYGDRAGLPKGEDAVTEPLSPYAIHKLTGEHLLRVYRDVHGLETVALRYFNVFGPRQDPASVYAAVIPRFVTRMLTGDAPIIYGDGRQSRDFTYVENVVEGNLAAAAAPAERAAGQVVNVAAGGRIDLIEFVELLNRLLGTRIEPVFEPGRPGEVRHSQADIRRAEEILGWRPTVDFEEGVRRTLDHYRRG